MKKVVRGSVNSIGGATVRLTRSMNADIISQEDEAPRLIKRGPVLDPLAKSFEGYLGVVCKMTNWLLVPPSSILVLQRASSVSKSVQHELNGSKNPMTSLTECDVEFQRWGMGGIKANPAASSCRVRNLRYQTVHFRRYAETQASWAYQELRTSN